MSFFKHNYYYLVELNYGRDETAVEALKSAVNNLDESFKRFLTDPDIVFKDECFKRVIPIKISSKRNPTPIEIDGMVEEMFDKFNTFRGGYRIISYLVRECGKFEYRRITTQYSEGDTKIIEPADFSLL